jgi:hypothetical protein
VPLHGNDRRGTRWGVLDPRTRRALSLEAAVSTLVGWAYFAAMIMYFVSYVAGESRELEADFFQRDGDDWVFVSRGMEVLRVRVEQVASISKSR